MNKELILLILLSCSLGCFHAAEVSERTKVQDIQFKIDSNNGQPVLNVRNDSNESIRITSDLIDVMEENLFGFPKRGALKFYNETGERIVVRGENPDGWWSPSILAANLELEKEPLGRTMRFDGGETKSYVLRLADVIEKARQFKSMEDSISVVEILIPISFYDHHETELFEVKSDRIPVR